MHKLILDRLDEELIKEVQSSFDDLPHTGHADSEFRLRRYSVIDFCGVPVGESTFTQSSDYNKYQGDVLREFEAIEDSVVNSKCFKRMLGLFRYAGEIDLEDIEVHQMRVTVPKSMSVAELSPEGPHQDGYDAVGIFSINRHNVCGGELLVFDDKNAHPFWTMLLKPGEVVIFNDRDIWHDGNCIERDVEGIDENYMDVFVFTARRD
tara:strand:- start:73 stop:693 length:621 start_codon:yes stop_codon:yes gene_type:complete